MVNPVTFLFLFSQISADTSQGDLAPATYDAGGVYNWPSVAGSNTKVTTTTTKQIMDRSIEGPPVYFDLKKWKKTYPQDVHTTDTVHDPYSGMIAPANLGANPNVYDPQYECFAWLGVSGLTNLGQVPGMGVGTTFTIRFEIMTEILFQTPFLLNVMGQVPASAMSVANPDIALAGQDISGKVYYSNYTSEAADAELAQGLTLDVDLT